MRKLIIFDIDGTLLLTGGAGKIAFDRVFSELFGIEGAWQEMHPDGRTDPSLIRELFKKNCGRFPLPEEYDQIVESYTRNMASALQETQNFRLMPGILELLRKIEERRLGLLGLATGNFESTAYLKLERGGLRDFFSYGGFGSDFRDRLKLTKLAVERGHQRLGRRLEPEEIILVGDTDHDVRCGKLLGLTTIAVATCTTPKSVLASLRPDFLLDRLSPLEEILPIFE